MTQDPTDHEFPTDYEINDDWDYNPTFAQLQDLLQYISADGESFGPPRLDHGTAVGLDTTSEQTMIQDRPLASDGGEITVYCHPNGDDDAEGTMADPISFEGALLNTPYFINAEYTIDLYSAPEDTNDLPAVYTRGFNAFNGGWTFQGRGTGRFYIQGNTANPADVEIDKAFPIGMWGHQDHMRVRGIQCNQSSQFNGCMFIENCNLYSRGDAGTPDQCVGSKAGILVFRGCEIGEGNTGTSFDAWGTSRVYIDSTTVLTDDTSNYHIDAGRGGIVHLGGGATFGDTSSTKGSLNMTNSELAEILGGSASTLFNGDGRMVMHSHGTNAYVFEPTDTFTGHTA